MKKLLALALVCLGLAAEVVACGCALNRPTVTRPVAPKATPVAPTK